MAIEQAHTGVVKQLYEVALNQNRPELLPDLLDVDVVLHSFTDDRGLAAYKALVDRLRTGFPDLHFTLEDLIATGDRVIVRWTMDATHNGPFGNVAATGKRIQQKAIVIYRFENGKIAEGWAQMDRLGVLQQIGAASAAPQPKQPAAQEAIAGRGK